jgi:Listeria/Bacterioides repeat/Listeria/Bacterioides repeat/Listeria/Bacterioides repeat/Listeria/Bacterioides repeat/Listeria/Bacterioides repeat/Listeria/Bacterioides repeat
MKKFKLVVLILALASIAALTVSCFKNTDGKFNIYFKNGAETYATIKSAGNEVLEFPDDPEREGYVFMGWYLDKDEWIQPFAENYFQNKAITKYLIVYAYWLSEDAIPRYSITFESNGGSSVSALNGREGDIVNAPADPAREGYDFGGWYTDNNFSNQFVFSAIPGGGATAYAKWNIKQFTLTFDSKGGSAVLSKTSDYNTYVSAPTAPTKAGYAFGGWYAEAALEHTYNFASPLKANATLYAKWNIASFNISFEPNGGPAVETITAPFGTAVASPSRPLRTGYVFEGWFTDDNAFQNAYAFDTMPAGNITLYAKWIFPGELTLEELYSRFSGGFNEIWPDEPLGELAYLGGDQVAESENYYISYLAGYYDLTSALIAGDTILALEFESASIANYIKNQYFHNNDIIMSGKILFIGDLGSYYIFTGNYLSEGDLYLSPNGRYLIRYSGDEDYFEIPDGVGIVGDYSFHGKKGTIVPESVHLIMNNAFGESEDITPTIFYKGDLTNNLYFNYLDNEINAYSFSAAPFYFPDLFWRYVDGVPTVWGSEIIDILPGVVYYPHYFTTYRFTAAAEGGYSIRSFASDEDFYYDVRLYDSKMNEIGTDSGYPDFLLTFYALVGKTYYLKVTTLSDFKIILFQNLDFAAISFDANGGTYVKNLTAPVGYSIEPPVSPVRNDYLFAGWYADDESFEEPYAFTVMPSEGLTLYAKWTPLDDEATLEDFYSAYLDLFNKIWSGFAEAEYTEDANDEILSAYVEYGAISAIKARGLLLALEFAEGSEEGIESVINSLAEGVGYLQIGNILIFDTMGAEYILTGDVYLLDRSDGIYYNNAADFLIRHKDNYPLALELSVRKVGDYALINTHRPISLYIPNYTANIYISPNAFGEDGPYIFYRGTEENWNANIGGITDYQNVYFYSDAPVYDGRRWHDPYSPLIWPDKDSYILAENEKYFYWDYSYLIYKFTPFETGEFRIKLFSSYLLYFYSSVTIYNAEMDTLESCDGSIVYPFNYGQTYYIEFFSSHGHSYQFSITREYKLIMEANGGYLPIDSLNSVAGDYIVLPAPTKEGFAFGGWYLDDETFLIAFNSAFMPAKDITLYAKWIGPSTITFVENGGSEMQDINAFEGDYIYLPRPWRAGHIFKGWFTDDGTFIDRFTSDEMPAGDITLYAKWIVPAPNDYLANLFADNVDLYYEVWGGLPNGAFYYDEEDSASDPELSEGLAQFGIIKMIFVADGPGVFEFADGHEDDIQTMLDALNGENPGIGYVREGNFLFFDNMGAVYIFGGEVNLVGDAYLGGEDGEFLIRYVGEGDYYEMPASVTKIGDWAFFNANLIGIVITSDTAYISAGEYTFEDEAPDIYFEGDETGWETVGCDFAFDGRVYFYSETELKDGKRWRYVGEIPTLWGYPELTLGTVYQYEGEETIYQFTPAETRKYIISSFNLVSGCPYVELYDDDMNLIGYSGGGSDNFSLSITLASGEVYFVKVSDYYGDEAVYGFSILKDIIGDARIVTFEALYIGSPNFSEELIFGTLTLLTVFDGNKIMKCDETETRYYSTEDGVTYEYIFEDEVWRRYEYYETIYIMSFQFIIYYSNNTVYDPVEDRHYNQYFYFYVEDGYIVKIEATSYFISYFGLPYTSLVVNYVFGDQTVTLPEIEE